MTLTRTVRQYWWLVLLAVVGGLYAWAYKFNNGLLGGIKVETDDHFAQRIAQELWGRRMVGQELQQHLTELSTGTQTRAQLREQFERWKTSQIAAGKAP